MATKVGARHVCEDCGSQLILVKPASGEFQVTCCGKPLVTKMAAGARPAAPSGPQP
jgi:hypothetical protein